MIGNPWNFIHFKSSFIFSFDVLSDSDSADDKKHIRRKEVKHKYLIIIAFQQGHVGLNAPYTSARGKSSFFLRVGAFFFLDFTMVILWGGKLRCCRILRG